MSILVCGSIAYDTIMVFNDHFRNHILPEKVHILNVSFMVPKLRREFGGCAGNIAYNLHLLETDAKPMATVGHDFSPYQTWMLENKISQDYIRIIEQAYTAQAYITTDLDDNQITAFHPGAMSYAEENQIPEDGGIELGIISPDGRDGMIEHAQQFVEAGIPFIFDPGQAMPMFGKPELLTFIQQATWITLNDYESQMLQQTTELSLEHIAKQVKALIITKGSEGSVIYTQGKDIAIPVAKTQRLEDPTGCGDAYRAGLLYGLKHQLDWETTGRLAALMGAIKIEQPGTQNHCINFDELSVRFKESFGRDF